MKSNAGKVLLTTVAASLGLFATAQAQTAKPDLVAKVAAGELKEARASWWGFNAEDSTKALQAAINSRVPKLIVDNMGAPWITDKLTCVSDQEIFFEPGTEVLAQKGRFTGRNDSLLTLPAVTNVILRGPGATLRMRRADYDAPPYIKAEWRHVLNLRSSVNIQIIGLTLAESGGDGIYLGCHSSRQTNRDILIRDVICDRNYRQGISVITAENLLIENTIMRDTAGTPPAAGIDFEPNHRGERLKNCVMRNCLTQNNQGDGYEFYLPNLHADSEPLSILIENCRSIGDRTAARVITANSEKEAVKGFMVFKNCVFKDAKQQGIIIGRKPQYGARLTFEDCLIENCSPTNARHADILLTSRAEDHATPGDITFERLTIRQPIERPWLQWHNNTFLSGSLQGIHGKVTLALGGKTSEISLTPEWVKANYPPRFTVFVPRVKADLAKAKIVGASAEQRRLEPIRLRRGGSYIFHATAGQEVVLVGRQTQVGRNGSSTTPLKISTLQGKKVAAVPLPPFREDATLRFTPDATAFYTLDVDVGGNAFGLASANVPIAFDTTERHVALISSTGSLYASLPPGTGAFAFGVAGEGSGEAVKATVTDPTGKVVWSRDTITLMERYTADKDEGKAGGLWRISFARPAQEHFEDFKVELLGAPAFLFLDKDRYWTIE